MAIWFFSRWKILTKNEKLQNKCVKITKAILAKITFLAKKLKQKLSIF